MNWYYKILGGHTHVRVFMNHAKCGDLCFRNEEFEQLRGGELKQVHCGNIIINFINEDVASEVLDAI